MVPVHANKSRSPNRVRPLFDCPTVTDNQALAPFWPPTTGSPEERQSSPKSREFASCPAKVHKHFLRPAGQDCLSGIVRESLLLSLVQSERPNLLRFIDTQRQTRGPVAPVGLVVVVEKEENKKDI